MRSSHRPDGRRSADTGRAAWPRRPRGHDPGRRRLRATRLDRTQNPAAPCGSAATTGFGSLPGIAERVAHPQVGFVISVRTARSLRCSRRQSWTLRSPRLRRSAGGAGPVLETAVRCGRSVGTGGSCRRTRPASRGHKLRRTTWINRSITPPTRMRCARWQPWRVYAAHRASDRQPGPGQGLIFSRLRRRPAAARAPDDRRREVLERHADATRRSARSDPPGGRLAAAACRARRHASRQWAGATSAAGYVRRRDQTR